MNERTAQFWKEYAIRERRRADRLTSDLMRCAGACVIMGLVLLAAVLLAWRGL